MTRCTAILLLFLCCARLAGAQQRPATPERNPSDTLPRALPSRLGGTDSLAAATARNERLYDTIQARYTRRAVPRMIYNALFVRRVESPSDGKAVDESRIYRPYEGRRINRIVIERRGLLIGRDSMWLERAANSLHATTHEWAIRRDLLYKVGQPLDADLVTRTNRNMRAQSHFSDVETLVESDPDDPDGVIVTVITQDNWSIGADAALNFNGRTMLKVYDANFLGSGSYLGVEQNFTWRSWDYGGTLVTGDVPNIFGTHGSLHLEAGRDFENRTLGADFQKPFLRRTDYALGASWYDRSQQTYMLYADSAFQVVSQALDIWTGGSLYLKGMNASLYLTGRRTQSDFPERPPVAPRLNPAFHEGTLWMTGAGFYRERFYTANLIYGYGYREYLSVGFRAELNAGLLEDEFGDEWYVGGSYRLGGFNRIGYLMGGIGIGSYISRADGRWGRGALNIESRYFTNLIKAGRRTRIRQFVTLGYLQGWNRYAGSDEIIAFSGVESLRGLAEYTAGVNRARLGLETVIFTPYQPLGFRLTAFVYSDLGLLGTDPNPLGNPFYSTVGIGIRLKNERLVFRAFELRLGVALGPKGLLASEYFSASAQPRIDPVRFIPEAPHPVLFR